MNNIFVMAEVDFRAALDALAAFVTHHDDPRDYCMSMVTELRLVANAIEFRLKEKEDAEDSHES